MKKIILSLALSVLCVLGVNAQSAGDWYIGTGDIANKVILIMKKLKLIFMIF